MVDAGTASAYTLFRSREITVDVRSNSAATIVDSAISPYRFASGTDRAVAPSRISGSVARRIPASPTRLEAGRFSYAPLEGPPC